MKLLITLLVPIFLGVVSCSTYTPKSVVASVRVPGSNEDRILDTINSYRSDKGLAPLVRHPGLDRLARQHSEYVRSHRGTFSLYGPNVSHFADDNRVLLAERKFDMYRESVSENVGYTAPHETVTDLCGEWLGSKPHAYNLFQRWDYTGIGCVTDKDGSVFATQIFATNAVSPWTIKNLIGH